eukprot:13473-Pyramimonas_sp.AAC.1
MGTMPNSRLAVRAAAACVHLRQRAACPTAAALSLGQHLLLGIVPFFPVPSSDAQRAGHGEVGHEDRPLFLSFRTGARRRCRRG